MNNLPECMLGDFRFVHMKSLGSQMAHPLKGAKKGKFWEIFRTYSSPEQWTKCKNILHGTSWWHVDLICASLVTRITYDPVGMDHLCKMWIY